MTYRRRVCRNTSGSSTNTAPSRLPSPPTAILPGYYQIQSGPAPAPCTFVHRHFSQQHKQATPTRTHPRFLIGRRPERRHGDHVLLTHVYKQAQSGTESGRKQEESLRWTSGFGLKSHFLFSPPSSGIINMPILLFTERKPLTLT